MYTLGKHTHSLMHRHTGTHTTKYATKYVCSSVSLKWRNKPCSWEKICLGFLQQTWLFPDKVSCYQILKLYWLLLAWKSDFNVGPAFYLRFYSVCGHTSTELPGVSCGELMWGFTVEVPVWQNTKEGHREPPGTSGTVGSLTFSESIPRTKVITGPGLFAFKAA